MAMQLNKIDICNFILYFCILAIYIKESFASKILFVDIKLTAVDHKCNVEMLL